LAIGVLGFVVWAQAAKIKITASQLENPISQKKLILTKNQNI
jgi:hypothetical protein